MVIETDDTLDVYDDTTKNSNNKKPGRGANIPSLPGIKPKSSSPQSLNLLS
jgi:hypothetical protein